MDGGDGSDMEIFLLTAGGISQLCKQYRGGTRQVTLQSRNLEYCCNYYLIARENKLGTIIIGRRKGWREGVEERVIGKMEREVSSRRDGSN